MTHKTGKQRRAAAVAEGERFDRVDPNLPGPRGVLSQWIVIESMMLLTHWGEAGWTTETIRAASALGDSILAEWGQGQYCIRRWVEWRERGVRQGQTIQWMHRTRT